MMFTNSLFLIDCNIGVSAVLWPIQIIKEMQASRILLILSGLDSFHLANITLDS